MSVLDAAQVALGAMLLATVPVEKLEGQAGRAVVSLLLGGALIFVGLWVPA